MKKIFKFALAKCTFSPPDCDLSRCQLVRDHQNCLFCSCPPSQRLPAIHIPPLIQTHALCPPFDKNTCTEPCMFFSNRLGCQECICPVKQPEVLASSLPSPVEFPQFISLPNLTQTNQLNIHSSFKVPLTTSVKPTAPSTPPTISKLFF